MPLKIIRDDITKLKVGAIVNAANSTLLGGGGVDGAIHKAAGPGLLMECMKLGGCRTGHAKLTKAYKLQAKYIIHTVGPKWKDGLNGEQMLLQSCYLESLRLAAANKCDSVAFPLISCGIYGYPKDQALKVAVDTITAFLQDYEMMVYLVVFDKASFQISEKLFTDIASYIDNNYVDNNCLFTETYFYKSDESAVLSEPQIHKTAGKAERRCHPQSMPQPKALSLEDAINQIDESFSEMLLRKIDEKGMTDAECYKKANVDRKLFSKIRSDIHYRPSKPTAIAFAISLELNLSETRDLLMRAGFALSHSNKFDIIIEYFITNRNYNIFEINEALFAFDQSLLG